MKTYSWCVQTANIEHIITPKVRTPTQEIGADKCVSKLSSLTDTVERVSSEGEFLDLGFTSTFSTIIYTV